MEAASKPKIHGQLPKAHGYLISDHYFSGILDHVFYIVTLHTIFECFDCDVE